MGVKMVLKSPYCFSETDDDFSRSKQKLKSSHLKEKQHQKKTCIECILMLKEKTLNLLYLWNHW